MCDHSQVLVNRSQQVVMCLDEARHGLEDGDYVSFSEVGVRPLLRTPLSRGGSHGLVPNDAASVCARLVAWRLLMRRLRAR